MTVCGQSFREFRTTEQRCFLLYSLIAEQNTHGFHSQLADESFHRCVCIKKNNEQKQIVSRAVDTIGDVETVVELEPLRSCRAAIPVSPRWRVHTNSSEQIHFSSHTSFLPGTNEGSVTTRMAP